MAVIILVSRCSIALDARILALMSENGSLFCRRSQSRSQTWETRYGHKVCQGPCSRGGAVTMFWLSAWRWLWMPTLALVESRSLIGLTSQRRDGFWIWGAVRELILLPLLNETRRFGLLLWTCRVPSRKPADWPLRAR